MFIHPFHSTRPPIIPLNLGAVQGKHDPLTIRATIGNSIHGPLLAVRQALLPVRVKTGEEVDPGRRDSSSKGLGLARILSGTSERVRAVPISVDVVKDKSNLCGQRD